MSHNKASKRIPRIGFLSPVSESEARASLNALIAWLGDLGYVEDRNIEIVSRFAEGRFERLPALAADLAGLRVDIIMPATPPAIQAAKAAAGSIPIVFPLGSDPVETGLVASLEHPGGNITGLATMSWMQSRPRMALVREAMPAIRRVALIHHSANTALQLQVQASRQAAEECAIELVVLGYALAQDLERTFESAGQNGAEALLPLSDPIASASAQKIAALSLQYRIPVVSPFRKITEAGGLLGYGPDLTMLYRRSAALVDQILKGAVPGDLPIGQPNEFELSVNLKAAKALDLAIPGTVMSRATHIYQ